MASAYHHAPNHIRRMLNQLFFEHVYLVPDQDAGQIAATATYLPPFDSILGLGGSPTGSEQTLLEGEESMKPLTTDPGERDEEQAATPATAASDQPHTTTTRRSTDPAGTTGSRGRKHQTRHAASEPARLPQTTKTRPEQAVFNPKTHA